MPLPSPSERAHTRIHRHNPSRTSAALICPSQVENDDLIYLRHLSARYNARLTKLTDNHVKVRAHRHIEHAQHPRLCRPTVAYAAHTLGYEHCSEH